jgi:hypothetical protein
MREKKYTWLFVLSSILVVALFFILGFAVTKSTDKVSIEKKRMVGNSNIPKSTTPLGDSLLVQYQAAVNDFDGTLDSVIDKNTGNPNFDAKLAEYYKLRREIAGLLKNKDSEEDIALAKQKIELLQQKIEALSNRNIAVEADNMRLNEIIRSLTSIQKANANVKSSATNFTTEKPVIAESNLFVASNVQLNTIAPNKDAFTNEDVEDKIQGSFLVKNSKSINNVELHIVVQKPDGEVVKNSAWDSGIFYTKDGQRKIYSLLLKFDYDKEETKKCTFSINADAFQKGNYLLQVYHKGVLIANSAKRIS